MANEIKLDVFTMRIKKHGKEEFVGFDEFYRTTPDSEYKNFESFFKSYVKSFNKKFWVHTRFSKAISITSKIKYASERRLIQGILEGGSTGEISKIKHKDDISDENAFTVTEDRVTSIPHYFLLWLPNDSNVGILILQSIGYRSISDILKEHLRRHFNLMTPGAGLSLQIMSYVPKEAEENMKKGLISSITLRRSGLPSTKAERLLKLDYKTDNSITIDLKISGLKGVQAFQDRIQDFFLGKISQLVEVESLDEIGIDGNHQTLMTFEHNGKTATGKLENNLKLAPTYYITDGEVSLGKDKHPVFDSISDYCESFLERIKIEIGYKKE